MKREKGSKNAMQHPESESGTWEEIETYLRTLRFRPRLFGVDKLDVWKKIERLNDLYALALREERARYEGLLGAAAPKNGERERVGTVHGNRDGEP